MVQSLTLTEVYIQLKLLPSLLYCYSQQCSYFAEKKQKWWSLLKKHAIYGPGLRFVSVLHENSKSQTGTKVTRVRSVTDTISDRSEFIFRLVPCKHMKRNISRPIQTHTSLSSSWSYVINYPLAQRKGFVNYRADSVKDSITHCWVAIVDSLSV